eukprot:gene14757-17436_t
MKPRSWQHRDANGDGKGKDVRICDGTCLSVSRELVGSNVPEKVKIEKHHIRQFSETSMDIVFQWTNSNKQDMVEKHLSPERKTSQVRAASNANMNQNNYEFSIRQKPAFISLEQPMMAMEITEQARTINVERQPPCINIGRASDIINVIQEPVNVTVTPGAPNVTVEPGIQNVEVETKAPEVEVEQYMPKITLKMPPIKVFLEMDGPPEILMDWIAPNIRVIQSDPIIRLSKAEPKIGLSQAPPKLTVTQEPASVEVIPSSKASIQVKEAQPNISMSDGAPTLKMQVQDQPKFSFQQGAPEIAWMGGRPTISVTQGDPSIALSNNMPFISVTPQEPTVSVNHRAPKIDVHRHPVSVSVVEPATTVHFGRPSSGAAGQHEWVQVRGEGQLHKEEKTVVQGQGFAQDIAQASFYSQWNPCLASTDMFLAQQGGARNSFVILNGNEQKLVEAFKEEKGSHLFNLNLRNGAGELLFKGESEGRSLKLVDSNNANFGRIECNKEQVDVFDVNGTKAFSLFPSTQRWRFEIKDANNTKVGSLHRPSKTSGYDLKFPREMTADNKMLLLSSIFLVDSVFD